VAAAYDDFLYTSSDSGSTWTQRGITGSWISVASSADGTKLAAVSPWGLVYTSTDAGVHWVPCESARVWSCVASSADGDKLVAVASSDCIYTGFMQHTAPGPTGYLSGTAAVELLYSGRDGVWWILSHEGTIETH